MAGRKRKLTDKLADQILELISDGKTIRETFQIITNYTWQSFRKELINDEANFNKMSEMAFNDPSTGSNPIALNKNDFLSLYEKSYNGILDF